MPRAFLIRHRRFDEEEELDSEPPPPPKGLRSDNAVTCCSDGNSSSSSSRSSCDDAEANKNSDSCPEELYNLTKLAEVAVASGQISEQRQRQRSGCEFNYSHKLFDKSSRRPHLIHLDKSCDDEPTDDPKTPTHAPDASALALAHEHECSDCGKKYSTSSNLARHRQTHRSPGDKKARRCPHCDKLYVSMPAFSMHVRTHNQGCKCQYCGKCFSRPWLLQGHIRTHTGEKPFKCSICNKAFADKSNLRAHVQTHSNTKPHVCARCGKAFALKSYLYKHEESSCMRLNNNNNNKGSGSSRETTPDKTISSPTPVIVSAPRFVTGASVIKNMEPVIYRSTVISPNPERLLYSTIEHPSSVILSAGARFGHHIFHHYHHLNHRHIGGGYRDDEPMDFSAQSAQNRANSNNNAISV